VNLVFEWLSAERVMVMYAGPHGADDTEWDAYLQLRRNLEGTAPGRILVYSEGGRPTREQQQRLVDVEHDQWPIAVVSPSAAVRFVVSVFSLEIPSIRLFTPEQLDEACAYLGCNGTDTAAVHAALERAKLAIEPAKIAGAPLPRARANTTGPIRIQPRTSQAEISLSPTRRGEPGSGAS
jgi:hypothetical protein